MNIKRVNVNFQTLTKLVLALDMINIENIRTHISKTNIFLIAKNGPFKAQALIVNVPDHMITLPKITFTLTGGKGHSTNTNAFKDHQLTSIN